MNRIIEYRGKTANPNQVENHNSYWVYGLLESSEIKEYPYMIAGCFVKPETIGQFTGLTDKIENKIFEGDIIKIDRTKDGLRINIVTFENGCFCIRVPNTTEYNKAVTFRDAMKEYNIRYSDYISPNEHEFLNVLEVIGNIYDNPIF
jgi:uncharacterized phage protein (TIGR01671 family)